MSKRASAVRRLWELTSFHAPQPSTRADSIIRKALLSFLLLGIAFLSGCTSPAQSYVSSHPGLTPAQRRIITTGNIPDGLAVAGLTKAEIRLAMGHDPAQFTKVDGADAWIFVREKRTGDPVFEEDYNSHSSGGQSAGSQNAGGMLNQAPTFVEVRTVVLFQGERATRAEVAEAKPAS